MVDALSDTDVLTVFGTSADFLVTEDNWTQGESFFDETTENNFDVFTSGASTLFVQEGIDITGVDFGVVEDFSSSEQGVAFTGTNSNDNVTG